MFCSTNVAEDFNKRIFASEETEEEKVFILKEVRSACVLIYNLFYQITGMHLWTCFETIVHLWLHRSEKSSVHISIMELWTESTLIQIWSRGYKTVSV